MTIAMIAVAAVLTGVFLGTCFKVVVLIPAFVISTAASVGANLVQGDHAWWAIVLVAFLTITALQVGYLAGSVIGFVLARRARKESGGLVATAQRVHGQS
jgi:hypothetical protein